MSHAFGPQRIGNASMLARGMEHRIFEDRASRILVAAEPAEDIASLVRRAQVLSEQSRLGKECVSTCSSQWPPSHYKNNYHTTFIHLLHTQLFTFPTHPIYFNHHTN